MHVWYLGTSLREAMLPEWYERSIALGVCLPVLVDSGHLGCGAGGHNCSGVFGPDVLNSLLPHSDGQGTFFSLAKPWSRGFSPAQYPERLMQVLRGQICSKTVAEYILIQV